jgi:hypothetical protein
LFPLITKKVAGNISETVKLVLDRFLGSALDFREELSLIFAECLNDLGHSAKHALLDIFFDHRNRVPRIVQRIDEFLHFEIDCSALAFAGRGYVAEEPIRKLAGKFGVTFDRAAIGDVEAVELGIAEQRAVIPGDDVDVDWMRQNIAYVPTEVCQAFMADNDRLAGHH